MSFFEFIITVIKALSFPAMIADSVFGVLLIMLLILVFGDEWHT